MPSKARADASSVLARSTTLSLWARSARRKTAAEHLVEHGERGVGENGLHLAREHDQGRQAARRVETRDIAGHEDGDFASDCRVTRAVNALLAIRPDAEFAHGLQPFDEGDEIFLTRRFRPFPQPGERRAILFIGDDEQRLQSRDRFWRQAFDEVLVRALCGQGRAPPRRSFPR